MENLKSDILHKLPTDDTSPSYNEIQIMDLLFKKQTNKLSNVLNDCKELLVIAILFVLFTQTKIDELVLRFIPFISKSPYFLILFKCILVIIIFWLIKHYYLKK